MLLLEVSLGYRRWPVQAVCSQQRNKSRYWVTFGSLPKLRLLFLLSCRAAFSPAHHNCQTSCHGQSCVLSRRNGIMLHNVQVLFVCFLLIYVAARSGRWSIGLSPCQWTRNIGVLCSNRQGQRKLGRVVSSIEKVHRFYFYSVINTDENIIQSLNSLSRKIPVVKHILTFTCSNMYRFR